mmetsp:Transcript_26658/g.38211  ORF Transcript_26658/g.38211 Transcript_26658/m.38211 type:complete len:350 (-) Transcript_26658:3829-4878(-)
MISIVIHFLIIIFSYLIIISSSEVSVEDRDKWYSLVKWIDENDGYVNPKLELSTGSDPSWKIRGVFATAPIEEDETLVLIPPELRFCYDYTCDVIEALAEEIRLLAKESFWWPYLSLLEDHDVDLPSWWTEEELELLSGLYPTDWTRHAEYFESECRNIDFSDPIDLRAVQLYQARSKVTEDGSEETCLIPVYDSINHGSLEDQNYVTFHGKRTIKLFSTQDIKAGAQLWNNYGQDDMGRLFRDYGYISSTYPKTWILVEKDDGSEISIQMESENKISSVIQGGGSDTYDTIVNLLSYVMNNEPAGIQQRSATMNPKRHALAVEYRKQYIQALEAAVEYMQPRKEKSEL